jgi:hypothetical protein
MSKDSYASFKISEFKIGSVSETISAAFGKPNKPSSQPRDSSVKKKLANLKEMSEAGKDTFLTEAQINEIEERVVREGYNPMSYEEMIKEVDDIRFGMKNRDYELMELRKRLERCRSEIEIREDGFNGIDRSLNDIHSQNKELSKRINSSMSLARLDN